MIQTAYRALRTPAIVYSKSQRVEAIRSLDDPQICSCWSSLPRTGRKRCTHNHKNCAKIHTKMSPIARGFNSKLSLYFFSPRLNHYGNRNRLNQYSGWSPLCADPVGKLEDDLLCRQTIRTVVKLFALRHRLEGVLDIKWRYVKNYGCCTCQCICSSSILGQVIPISSVTLIGYSN